MKIHEFNGKKYVSLKQYEEVHNLAQDLVDRHAENGETLYLYFIDQATREDVQECFPTLREIPNCPMSEEFDAGIAACEAAMNLANEYIPGYQQ